MKFKEIVMIISLISFTFLCCRQAVHDTPAKPLNLATGATSGAYFTRDQHNAPVLCWTEQGADSLYRLRYAHYDAKSNSFLKAVTVPGSSGTSISAESMGKIAFKADGTILAIYGKRFPQEKSPYAGAIYYSMSTDQGQTWSPSTFVHSDTAHHYGRSFFDISRLPNGELAAVWLDGRYGKNIKGSALFFAKTETGEGFGQERCLEKGTCECCRTNITTDEKGRIHIAYRSIMYPSALFGAQVRDMAYVFSDDQGKSFTRPETISEDNWKIDGCPHSGPSMATNKIGLHALWFTAGGKPGIYLSSRPTDKIFSKRALITEMGRHPQMTAWKDGRLALVFEEPQEQQVESHGAHGHTAGGESKIILSLLKDGTIEKSINLSDGKYTDHHAVITPLNEGLLVAWMSERYGKPALYYRYVPNL